MRIERVTLHVVRLPLKTPYVTSGSTETHESHVLAKVESEGLAGWGESVAPERPWYSGETTSTVLLALEEFLLPALFAGDLASAGETGALFAHVREHRMAKATVEMAVWDLFARRAGVPLATLLGGTRDRILCGVAIGLKPTMAELLATIERELRSGYRRVKVKVRPGDDLAIARAIRERFPTLDFMVDANSAYTLDDLDLFRAMDETRPMMIEQPLAHDDLVDHAALQREIRTPICLDESIHSGADARKAIAIRAGRIVNIKAGRVGGHAEAKRVHDVCAAAGIPVWCGGMLEMGIGRAHNVHLAALPNFSLPGDVAASSRYFDTELIGEPFAVEADGTMRVPTGPGLGVTVLEDRIRSVAASIRVHRPT